MNYSACKFIIFIILLLLPTLSFSEHVNGYYRKDGTYVQSHERRRGGTESEESTKSLPYIGPPLTGHEQTYSVKNPSKSKTTIKKGSTTETIDNESGVRIIRNYESKSNSPFLGITKYGTLTPPEQVHKTGKADNYIDGKGILRDGKTGNIHRSQTAKNEFRKQNPCPGTGKTEGACPGYVIDHIQALKRGGKDSAENMQWQTTHDAKTKDKWE